MKLFFFAAILFFVITLTVFGGFLTSAQVQVQIQGGQPVSAQSEPPSSPSSFLDNLYVWMLGIVGLASLFALVWGGVLYIFSGAIESTAEAKKWMTNAFWGLLIAGASYLILRTINPELVKKFNIESIIQQRTPP